MRGWIGIRCGASTDTACHNCDSDEDRKPQHQHAIVRLPHHAHFVPPSAMTSQPALPSGTNRKESGNILRIQMGWVYGESETGISVSCARETIKDSSSCMDRWLDVVLSGDGEHDARSRPTWHLIRNAKSDGEDCRT